MDVSYLITKEVETAGPANVERRQHLRPHLTRSASSSFSQAGQGSYSQTQSRAGRKLQDVGLADNKLMASEKLTGLLLPAKTVNFQLMLSNAPQHRARLPLRVQIKPTDTTESIISTVKNFYGLYEGEGVSFEDNSDTTLIAQYENLDDNATVYVRVTAEQADHVRPCPDTTSPRKPRLGEPFQMLPPQPYIRPHSRSRKRPASPSADPRRGSVLATLPGDDANNGFSDSDAGSVSVSSSRRAKMENLASADISVDNIVEGGRRKRAKFESSELPLFIPPQVPMTTSMSSASPQRRFTNGNVASPQPYNQHHAFAYNYALPSPQSYKQGDSPALGTANGTHRQSLRSQSGQRPGQPFGSAATFSGALPTPDPTIGGSVISDEDVALQLMRLGDATNFSHGRTSTSTLDDALSGKAEVASSVENSEDDSGSDREQEVEDHKDGSFQGESDKIVPDSGIANRHRSRPKKSHSLSTSSGQSKLRVQVLGKSKSKSMSSAKIPQWLHASSGARKGSNSSTSQVPQQYATDEDDLSSKPRCQRCRKSKKGCDRQRPCQRCKDAGIGADGCISEDEGNGRKGKFGRHMGVPVRKDILDAASTVAFSLVNTSGGYLEDGSTVADKPKKGKR